jgi:hypothetical protein
MGKASAYIPKHAKGKNKDKVLMVMYAVADIINKINIIAQFQPASGQPGQSAA